MNIIYLSRLKLLKSCLIKKINQKNAKPVSLYVKDEYTGMDVSVRCSSIEESLRLFKEKSFTYLFNSEYVPTSVRAELRAQAEMLMKQGPISAE